MLLPLLVALLDPAAAQPPEDASRAPSAAPASDFVSELEHAKQEYFAGRHQEALRLFQALQVRLLDGTARPDWDLAAQAMIYVAEVNLELGRPDAARSAFHWVLERDPDYTVSPYHHPANVRLEFMTIQQEVQAEIAAREANRPPPPVPERTPLPAWGYMPFGVPQFAQRRPVAGVAHLGLQLALGAGSLAMMKRLIDITPDELAKEHPLGWTVDEYQTRVRRQRYLVQWPLTFGFYGAWAASALDAGLGWRAARRPPNSTVLAPRGAANSAAAPGPDGSPPIGVGLTGRW